MFKLSKSITTVSAVSNSNHWAMVLDNVAYGLHLFLSQIDAHDPTNEVTVKLILRPLVTREWHVRINYSFEKR